MTTRHSSLSADSTSAPLHALAKFAAVVASSFAAIGAFTLLYWFVRAADAKLQSVYGVSMIAVPLVVAVVLFSIFAVLRMRTRRAEKLKYEFITVAAHRLRTPLTRLGWMVAGIRDELSTPQGRQLAEDADRVVHELTDIADRLLSAAEAKKPSLYYSYIPEEEDMGLIARQAAGDYGIGATKKNIKFSVAIPESLPKVYVDRDRIRTAIGVFLENAILYTPFGGTMELRVAPARGGVEVSVRDSGVGILADELPYVFTKFYRTRAAVAADADRAGLGLAIGKDIIERHGGKVGARSEGKDRGSVFWFWIPGR